MSLTPDANEEYWARYFLKVLLAAPTTYNILFLGKPNTSGIITNTISSYFSQQLIISYLQLICYYAARQLSDRLQQSPNLKVHYPLEDCFLIACEAALKPAKLLKRFNFQSPYPLHGYARKALNRIIQNQVVTDLKIKSIKFSDNGLLRSLSPGKMSTALTAYGLTKKGIKIHLLAVRSFNDLYEEFYPASSNGSRKNHPLTTSMSMEQLRQIATRYNQQLQRLEIEQKPINGQEMKKMLATCIQAARSSQNKRFVSIEEHGEVKDIAYNSLDGVIEKEERSELDKFREVILQEFSSLDNLAQTSLLLWLGLDINQSDFVGALNLKKQYQVARQFQRYQKTLLKAVTKYYAREYLAKTLTQKELNQICKDKLKDIKDYLNVYSKQFFSIILDIILTEQISCEEKTVLRQSLEHVGNSGVQSLPPEGRGGENVAEIKEKIQQLCSKVIEAKLKIQLDDFSSARLCLAKFIHKWLQQKSGNFILK